MAENLIEILLRLYPANQSTAQPQRVEATRRRERVNHRQRYESRGVDEYRRNNQDPPEPGPVFDVVR